MSATVAKISAHENATCWTPEPKNSLMKRADGGRITAQRFEVGIPVLAGGLKKIEQAAADAPNCRNFQFSGANGLIESARLERFRAGHGFADVIDIDRDRADAGAMSDVVRMRKAIGLAIDDQLV